ncbi:MAG: hypothetical protein J6125_03825 [Clostridia bacterium]|nr:hypothetical protein [Clostridia bacterium]
MIDHTDDRAAVLERILTLMRAGAHTDAGMERALSLAPRTVSNWRRGVSHSYMDRLPDVAAYLRVPQNVLTGDAATADLAAEEATLLAVYREAAALSPARRKALLDALCRVIRLATATDARSPKER